MPFPKSFIMFIVAAFTVWILPLGVYYSLAQEAELCGGKRAICLCKRALQKVEQASKVKVYQNASSQPSESVNDPASSPKFMTSVKKRLFFSAAFFYKTPQPLVKNCDGFFRAIEHVPLVHLSA